MFHRLKRLVKSPLFCGSFFILCVLVTVALFTTNNNSSFPLKRNVFDESQYLFSAPVKLTGPIDVNIVSNTVLEPMAPPFLVEGRVFGTLAGYEAKREIEQYIVQPDDTLGSVAQKFGISLETLLWANDLTSSSLLKVGQKLIILPVSGAIHIVREGDTLSELAELYQVEAADITDFNELADEGKIYTGDLLIIPGGKKPKVLSYTQVPLSQSYFICPIPSPCRITQGLHWFNAVDFSNGKCGEPIFAAAGGTVQITGYGSKSGNYARVLHANGVVTFYGHLSKIAVSPGDKVYQGQIIGYMGYTGYTIPAGPAGCHVHFDVRFAVNPFAKYAVGTELGKLK